MEIKYCERCGKLLGYVMKSKKYCIDCYAIVNREKDRERHRKKQAIKEAELKKACTMCLVRKASCKKSSVAKISSRVPKASKREKAKGTPRDLS